MKNIVFKKQAFVLLGALFLLVITCMCQRPLICNCWTLQEVQIPADQEYLEGINYDYLESICITDNSFTVYDAVSFSVKETWNYTINNSFLLLNSGNVSKSFFIKKLTNDELILVEERTVNGSMVLRFVRAGEESSPFIEHNKYN